MKQPSPHPLAENVDDSVARALDRLAASQEPDGSWHGDYGGPMFLLPMFVALCHVAGKEIPEKQREEMRREFQDARFPKGWIGLHREGQPCLFTTVLGYVSLRLLGESAEDSEMKQTLRWIHENGGPHGAAPWGKWILCLLGLYSWNGVNPVTPELWLLPKWFPLHPGRLWCHCRMVYLPASWLYGNRSATMPDERIREIRDELYPQGWDELSFAGNRNTLAPVDNVYPPRWPVRFANRILSGFEKWIRGTGRGKRLRQKALAEVMRQIEFEETVTNGIAIGPVNRVLNSFCFFFSYPDGEAFQNSLESCRRYLWKNGDRCLMQGYNNSKLWDTVFAAQAVIATHHTGREKMLTSAFRYIDSHQVREDVPDREEFYRERSAGGWPFSDIDHGWPIADCTAEGLKTALTIEKADSSLSLPGERLFAAVDLLLDWQNPDGGWPTYEKQRVGKWIESMNPSGVFGRIMIDYSYPECTSAVLQAFAAFREKYPDRQKRLLNRAMMFGEDYLRREQRDDGSWEGSWGVCFTYGTWFGVKGMLASGTRPDDPTLRRAAEFLLSKQREDGSWGEAIESCLERRWIDSPNGNVVQTSWALLALLALGESGDPVDAAANFILTKQQRDGNWPNEGMVGMFNRTCAINYDWYRLYFPMWALAEWRNATEGTSPSPA
ncbi:MAG: hypothetical protein MI807_11680 [Verrucomicrobiales bacterium]|nr:hypothetical protein [Verrucomicrobiales bacterium]